MMHWLMRLTVKKKMAVLRYCAGCNQSRKSRVTPALNRQQRISRIPPLDRDWFCGPEDLTRDKPRESSGQLSVSLLVSSTG